MSLSDSLKTAGERVGKANSEANMERTMIANYKKAIAKCIEASLQEAVEALYKSLCDAVADQIYSHGNTSDTHIEGFVNVPGSWLVKLQDQPEYHDYHSKVFSAYCKRYNNGFKFQEDADAIHKSFTNLGMPHGEDERYSYLLFTTSRESGNEGFGIIGYHRTYSMDLTDYGHMLVEKVEKLALSDGIKVNAAVLFKVGEYRKYNDYDYTEIRSLGRSFRENSKKRVTMQVILKYSYN